MESQNVTLSIPKEVLQKAKLIAIRRKTSLSGLMTHALEDIVAQDEEYELARKRHLEILRKGFDLGTQGKASWLREDLHDR